MAVTAKKRKKLFQIAKELNLATETISEFLEKQGVKVKTPNMRVEQEDYEAILKRFSHEKKAAEKIHKRREERIREEEEAERIAEQQAELETAEAEDEDEPVDADVPEIEAEAPPETESEAADIPETDVDAAPVEATETAEVSEAEAPVETDADEPEPTVEAEAAPDAEVADADVEETPDADTDATDTPVEAAEAESGAAPDVEDVAEPEAPEVEAETEAPEEEAADDEKKPQVGDIIDHPMARKYQEHLRREAEVKKAREESKTKAEDAKQSLEEELEERRKKKGKKKDKREIQEEKDARRRKAFEMLRKEGKKIRPQAVSEDAVEEEGATPEKEGRRKRKRKRKEVDQKEVDSSLKKTLAEMRDTTTGKRRRRRVKTEDGEVEEEVPVIKVTEFITTQDLANLLDSSPTEIIRKCLELGLVVTINQRLDMDTIRLLAEEFGFDVEEEEEFGSDFLQDAQDEEKDDPAQLEPRPPVVTIMGHVDHGKTSLLDYIRSAKVVEGESGGITQHIGAYEVETKDGRRITFLDTPGHEAFTAMRARGAQVTDIVVLVVAADDRVMPQTEEAIDHARAAGVKIVIAINKVDKPDANPEAIRKQLADRNILVEDWGGEFQSVEVSAKTGKNVDDLLEKILLEAELLDLKANPAKKARGVVLEARLDKGKGTVATVLVEAGTLEVGQAFIVGTNSARVRAMFNERGQRVDAAGPSTPVQVLGIDGIPEAGDRFIVMEDDREVREVAQRRQQLKREQDFRQVRLMTLDELSQQIQSGNVKELKVLVKADVDGSAQAIADSLQKIENDEVSVDVIRRAVGPIAESDVILAAASQAIIIGFNVRPTLKAKELAEKEHVDIRLYKVIYDAIEDVEKALEGMLSPIEREVVTGTVEVRNIFKISRVGTVAGCYVLKGKINRNSTIRLVRNDVEIYHGKLSTLKRFKDDVREVQSGYECGLTIENFNDIKEGDLVEAFEVVHEAQTLKK